MFTSAAVILLIAGIILMKTWPVSGFLVVVAAIALAMKAVKTPDDIEWFGGLCLMLAGAYSIYLFAVKLL